MKILLPVVLLVIIAILGSSLAYEIAQKNRAGRESFKGWEQTIITGDVQTYQDLNRGDVKKVEVGAMLRANVAAKSYVANFGYETGTTFATNLAEAFAIYEEYQATNR